MAGWRLERVERIRGERRAHHGFRRKVGRHEASVGSSLDSEKQPEGDCPQRAGMRMKLLAMFVVLGALPRTGHCVRPAKQAAFRSRSTSDTGGLSVSAPRLVRRSASSTETATRLPFPRTWTTTAMTPVAPRCHWMRWKGGGRLGGKVDSDLEKGSLASRMRKADSVTESSMSDHHAYGCGQGSRETEETPDTWCAISTDEGSACGAGNLISSFPPAQRPGGQAASCGAEQRVRYGAYGADKAHLRRGGRFQALATIYKKQGAQSRGSCAATRVSLHL